MLVIVSDLHLTDGTSGTTISSNAFAILRYRLEDLAVAASDQELNGRRVYKPVSDIHLLFLGDILDVIRSTRWLKGDVRPWHDPDSPAFVSKVDEITQAILDHNKEAADIIRGLGTIEIPETPDSEKKVKVNVHKHYIIGNHDWFYHLPSQGLNATRASIVAKLGLDNDPARPFPHDTKESFPGETKEPAIRRISEEHRVFACHGDKFDGRNYTSPTRDASSIGDAVVIELLNRFTQTVETQLGEKAPAGLREIDNVRPMELIPVWLDGLLKKKADRKTAHEVRTIWNGVVRNFLNIDFVKERHDSLKWGLRLSEGFSFRDLGKIVPLGARFMEWLGLTANYAKCAEKEEAFKDPKYSYIVFGHTHHHEVVPLRTTASSGGPEGIYLNSGTWRVVFDRARDGDFFAYRVMTYLVFFNGSERHGSSFETWSASLEYPELNPGLTRAHGVAAGVTDTVTAPTS